MALCRQWGRSRGAGAACLVAFLSAAAITFRVINGTDGQNHTCMGSVTGSDGDVLQADFRLEVRHL